MRRARALMGLAMTVALLAGCTSSTDEPDETPTSYPTIPSALPTTGSSPEHMEEFYHSHSWTDEKLVEEARDNWEDMVLFSDNEAVMVMYGSSSCPPNPDILVKESKLEDGQILVTDIVLEMEDYRDRGVCTADLGPHFTAIEESPQFSISPDLSVTAKHPHSDETSKIPAFYGTSSP